MDVIPINLLLMFVCLFICLWLKVPNNSNERHSIPAVARDNRQKYFLAKGWVTTNDFLVSNTVDRILHSPLQEDIFYIKDRQTNLKSRYYV